MPLRNRVLPDGEILAHPARGHFMGNRGILHDDEGRLTARRWTHKAWVTCALSFKGRRRHPLMQPRRYTELFFHDEAVAFAAGHRPCAECRRADYLRFRAHAGITGPIADYDRSLHAERTRPRLHAPRRYQSPLADLPDGVFVRADDGPPASCWAMRSCRSNPGATALPCPVRQRQRSPFSRLARSSMCSRRATGSTSGPAPRREPISRDRPQKGLDKRRPLRTGSVP